MTFLGGDGDFTAQDIHFFNHCLLQLKLTGFILVWRFKSENTCVHGAQIIEFCKLCEFENELVGLSSVRFNHSIETDQLFEIKFQSSD